MTAAWSPRHLRWLGIGSALLAAILAAPAGAAAPRSWIWLATFGLFLFLFWLAAGEACAAWRPGRRLAALAAASSAGLALVALGGGAFAATFLVLVAAVAGSVLAARSALLLVATQTLALGVAFVMARADPGRAALLALVFGGLQLFVLHTAQVARAESAARRELEETHRNLQIAQERLAAASRDAERLRIARELHDVMGHHLTALSLTLEAASHAAGEAKDGHVVEALVLTKRLLRDVRQVVSALREEPADLAAGLRRLAAEAKGPRVHLALAGDLPAAPGAQAQALLRCGQETVTNAARHGRAANLWIDLSARDAGWLLQARDDGHAEPPASAWPGHGLRGVEERVSELGGRVRWGPAPSGGFEIEAWIPAPARETS